MTRQHDIRFPNESDEYREKRTALLEEEIRLRDRLEQIAELRRQLPMGGSLKEDYVFDELLETTGESGGKKETRFSSLFEDGKNTLLLYNFMFAPDATSPCPACTSMIDGLNGSAPHIRDKVNFSIVARAPIEKFHSWAQSRNWNNLRLLSSLNNTYNHDYFGESSDGSQQMPVMNVFEKTDDGIFHFYSTELLFTAPAENQHPRHADLFWPVWNLFDLTPDGRGSGWFPKTSYD